MSILTKILRRMLVKQRWLLLTVLGVVILAVFSYLAAPVIDDMTASMVRDSRALSEHIFSLSATPPTSNVLGTHSELYPVVSVTDGDTFRIDRDGVVEKVRIVGINTPETVDPRRSTECFGNEASFFARSLLDGQRVRLETDPTQQDRDRYGRLLRFVFLEDGRDVGLTLIQAGMAEESLYSSTPHRYHAEYVAAQQIAQKAERGLWAADACTK